MKKFPVSFSVCIGLVVLWNGTSSAELAKIELKRANLASSMIEDLGSKLANSLVQKNFSDRPFTVQKHVDGTPVFVSSGLDENLVLSYRDHNNEIAVLNSVVTSDNVSDRDVGEVAAEDVFKMALQSVRRDLDLKNLAGIPMVRRSRIIHGEGPSGQLPVERVKEYIFTLPRIVNGVEVMNSGVEISVHRDGRLARVMTFGPDLKSMGGNISRGISDDEVDVRVLRENQNASVKKLGLRYWLPEGLAYGVVLPKMAYFVTPVVTRADGTQVQARGHVVLYSLEDPSEPAVEWPLARPEAKGDPR